MAIFTDPLGQEVELGDVVVIGDGGWANLSRPQIVTRKGSTDLIQLNGHGYTKQCNLLKINTLIPLLPEQKQREIVDLRSRAEAEGWLNEKVVPKKPVPTRYLILAAQVYRAIPGGRYGYARNLLSTKYYLVEMVGTSQRAICDAKHEKDAELRSTLSEGQLLDTCLGIWSKPRRGYGDREGLYFFTSYNWDSFSRTAINNMGLEVYINKELPFEAIESVTVKKPE